jgi:hypothetical protein
MIFSDPVDDIKYHDLMMLVLSYHAHFACPTIIRIALPLLLSSVAMFLHFGHLPSLFFFCSL